MTSEEAKRICLDFAYRHEDTDIGKAILKLCSRLDDANVTVDTMLRRKRKRG